LAYAQYALDGLGVCSAAAGPPITWNPNSRAGLANAIWTYVKGRRSGTVSRKLPSARTDVDDHERSYIQIDGHRPNFNRYWFGYFLNTTKLEGIFGWTYSWPVPGIPDPYALEVSSATIQHGVVYPSTAGPVPTLQWEAVRAGIDDYRGTQLVRASLASLAPTNNAVATWRTCMSTAVEARLERYKDPIFFDDRDKKDFRGTSTDLCYEHQAQNVPGFLPVGAEDYDRTRTDFLRIASCVDRIKGNISQVELTRMGVDCRAVSTHFACTWP
jgi:hypothetical protein